jgi:hypothetical protein
MCIPNELDLGKETYHIESPKCYLRSSAIPVRRKAAAGPPPRQDASPCCGCSRCLLRPQYTLGRQFPMKVKHSRTVGHD